MWTEPNREAEEEIAAAEMRGLPPVEIRSRAIKAKTFRIDPDQPIYRIAELFHVEQDIKQQVLSYRYVHQGAWNDPCENPIARFSWLQNIVNDYCAVCWSRTALSQDNHWRDFSHGEPAVRLESTPRLLLERLMHLEDPFMNLRHFIGGVRYAPIAAIEAWLSYIERDYTAVMDTQGIKIAQSFMLLKADLQDEQEVRVVCTSLKNSGETWWIDHVRAENGRVKLPFNWRGALKSLVLGPTVDSALEQSLKTLLAQAGISCPVTRTSLLT